MSRGLGARRVLFSSASARIFLRAWVFSTLVLVLAVGLATFIHSIFVDGLAFSLFIVLYWFLCPIPALFVAVCVLVGGFLGADTRKSENLVLVICTIAFGGGAGLPAGANVVVMAFWAALGFLSAVTALIMTKPLRLASRAGEASR